MPGTVPVGRIAALLAILVGGIVLARGGGTTRFRGVARGVEFTSFRGDPYCRQGSSEIAVLRLDPAHARVHVRHYARDGDRPLDILEWQSRTRSIAVFNAGQYYPDWSYMGLLVCGGRVVSNHPHPTFQAALVAGAAGGSPAAHVLDLSRDSIDADHPAWLEVAQSFMLFDRTGAVRVKQSAQIAPRTIVAEDRDRRLVVITTEGAYTLFDVAHLLKASPFHLTHAMSMDGGGEAQLCVRSGAFHYASFGRWNPGVRDDDLRAALVPLPAVVTVSSE
jgi:hypothetical protein